MSFTENISNTKYFYGHSQCEVQFCKLFPGMFL